MSCHKCHGGGIVSYEAMGENCSSYCDCQAALLMRLFHVNRGICELAIGLRSALELAEKLNSQTGPEVKP